MKIKSVNAFEVLDSRGQPTVSAQVVLDNGAVGKALVPSGASTGSYEAIELRDGDQVRYHGGGVLQVVQNIKDIIGPAIYGLDPEKQEELDNLLIKLDGTNNKSKLGANSILAVSLAVARAAANGLNLPLYQYLAKFNRSFNGEYLLPLPMLNVLNGGKHANWATDIQEYLVIPVGAKSIAEAVRCGAEVYQSLKKVVKEKGYSILVGDEGGFAPAVKTNAEAFELLKIAVENAGYQLGQDIIFGIDAAATEFYAAGKYNLKKEGLSLNSFELASFYRDLQTKYPVLSLEDIFAEDDWDGFVEFMKNSNGHEQIIGDDLYVTNVERLQKGIDLKASNSILIKLNQIGTLSETIKTINLAHDNGLTTVISHRSGETEDSFIADLAVAMGAGQIKTGAPARSERTAKYNRLIEIEQELRGVSKLANFPF